MGFLDTNTKRGYLAIVGCLLVDISVGEYNLLGFLYPYFGSYFHYQDSKITMDDTPLVGATWLAAQAFAGVLGVFINNYLSFRWTFLLFVLLFCVGQFAASFVTNFYLFLLVYAVPGGIAQGALVILPLYCAWRYFPDKHKGKISGIILSAYALAPILTSFIAQRIINPNDVDVVTVDGKKYFPQDVANQVPKFIRTFCIICLGLGLLGVCLIVEPLSEEEKTESSTDQIEPLGIFT
jgi:MFS family permease